VKVLVVDDSAINRVVLRAMAEGSGAAVDESPDGPEALEVLAVTRYDVIFLDIHMPTLSGFEVVAALRSSPGPSRGATVIAVTADTTAHRADYLAAGFDDYFNKPISLEAVRAALKSAPTGSAVIE
jgi:two-component system, sensor histidine kinase